MRPYALTLVISSLLLGACDGDGGSGGGGSASGDLGDASGVSIQEVAFYQGVKSTVFDGGSPQSPSVRLVAERPAVVRVFAEASGTTGAPITARLYIGQNAPIEVQVGAISSPSESDISSTINFDVPASYLTQGATWRVELKEDVATSQGANPGATTPDGNLDLEQSHPLRVTLIPVQYQADRSNRMPDTSPEQLERYRQLFMKLYPTTEVVLQVGPTLPWRSPVGADGSGWDGLLLAVAGERENAGHDFRSRAKWDEFYYGIFEPASSLREFCRDGCQSGFGLTGASNDTFTRAAIGLGYSGDRAAVIAVHEVGHNHGLYHSPCGGPSTTDPNYPYSNADIGVWGMDIFTKQLFDPGYKDFMGYCDPRWVSDHVYEQILSFMQAIGWEYAENRGGERGENGYIPPEAMNQPYDCVSFGIDGAKFLPDITMKKPPLGTVKTVTITTASGETQTVQGAYYPYDHIDGGVLLVKKSSGVIKKLSVDLEIGGTLLKKTATR